MPKQPNLFPEFEGLTKETWLAKVEKDLKGRPFSDLEWELEENIAIEPFYHLGEVAPVAVPGKDLQPSNEWKIGEYLDVLSPKSGNLDALEGLNGGAEALLFRLQKSLPSNGLEQLLAKVEPTFIDIHFSLQYAEKKPWILLRHFIAWLNHQQADLSQISGSIDFDPFLDWTSPPIDKLVQLFQDYQNSLPLFKFLQVNARPFHHGTSHISRELAYTIAKGNEYLAQLSDQGLAPEMVNKHMQFSMAIGTSYFVEIAKLRALRLLWSNVLDAYDIKSGQCTLQVHFAWESRSENQYDNMIRASTQAMSAVIGGTDELYIWPSNADRKSYSNAFSRRIARNVQHLLKMESYLDRVVDPAAGSYYIEKLTQKLAEKAWEIFQDIEAKGGFMKV